MDTHANKRPIGRLQGALLEALRAGGPQPEAALARQLGTTTVYRALQDLRRKGMVIQHRDRSPHEYEAVESEEQASPGALRVIGHRMVLIAEDDLGQHYVVVPMRAQPSTSTSDPFGGASP